MAAPERAARIAVQQRKDGLRRRKRKETKHSSVESTRVWRIRQGLACRSPLPDRRLDPTNQAHPATKPSFEIGIDEQEIRET